MNEKGITLTVLVLTIIVLAIITAITINIGFDSIRSARLKKFESELEIIQLKFNELLSYGWTESDFANAGQIFANIGDSDKITRGTNLVLELTGFSDASSYIYFNKSTLEKLGIVGIDREIIMNLSRKIIIDINGVKDADGKNVYTVEWMQYMINP